MQPLLSICIPTFNRRKYLQETLEHLVSQLNQDVEVIIFDNHSSDDTHEYLQSLSPRIQNIRQKTNVGADRNMADCLQAGSGQYIWMLCDDDFPYSNTVEEILGGIKHNSYPPFLFLRTIPADATISQYSEEPSPGGWTSLNRDTFLEDVGAWCTFASSIVAKRDCIDNEFIKSRIGTLLVPAAATLSTIGKHNCTLISDAPLLYVRSDNTGGYSALTVFTKEFKILLNYCKSLGYSSQTLENAYKNSLSLVVPVIVEKWKIDFKGLLNLVRFSYKYKILYQKILPIFLKRMAKLVLRRKR